MKSLLLIAALLAAGCTTTYTRPDSSTQQFAQDKYACDVETERAQSFGAAGSQQFVTASLVGAAIGAGIAKHHRFAECMAAHGWSPQ
jgi:dsRNA-specific ribonuclease